MKFYQSLAKPPGTAPGTIAFEGDRKLEKVRLRMFRYDRDFFEEKEFEDVASCVAASRERGIKWINLDGLHDAGVLKQLGDAFHIHPLVLEDIANTTQRPKVESYDHHLYVVVKMFYLDGTGDDVIAEQMSFVLGDHYVLSFQERVGDVFEQVRQRIRTGGAGYIRKHGPDYLLYALLDAIVDHYFVILEKVGDALEDADDRLGREVGADSLREIHELKKKILFLKKSTWPLRELFSSLVRLDSPMIKKDTVVFMRDVYDHVTQVLDNLENFREMVSGLTDLYQTSMGNRMNEVMKVLTIIATIFIPPTFVAGIYGMNFENMPELHSRFGYFFVLGVILTSMFSMLCYFRKKKWI